MACFLAPTAEAIVLSIVKHHVKKKEELSLPSKAEAGESAELAQANDGKISFSRKLSWLTNLLWGGSFLLLIEHIWHGEIVPWAPFITAMSNKADTVEMFKEIATAGVSMALLCTAVWCVMLVAAKLFESRRANKKVEAEACA